MALNIPFQFPFLSPSKTLSVPHHHRLPAEVRFSRWNNANAQKFIRRQKTQQEIEDQLRFQKRFDSAQSIVFNNSYNPAPPHPTFKSTGTPSSPSRPSIPGKKSKYSKDPNFTNHPAFKPIFKTRQIPIIRKRQIPCENAQENDELQQGSKITPDIQIDDKGISYQFPDAPFVYQYSYTETPKVKPLGIREPLVAPFEPSTMGRPWTGRKPLPPSKKNLPEFDSFKLPPPHKKGVKPVQAPGPYLPGSGPKYVQSREEILGDPLTKEEIDALVASSRKSTRQLNIGRDGLTHNMLDNIHALWKRKRVCKIKCKGVCTVDMDNVRQQLEEKTGGQVIFSRGGVIFLFRGRNYNYKYRPRYPLMLWKPVTPVYPRLVKRAPEGLTLEQATEMRKKGRKLNPICKLGKNGVYVYLVKDVREAFEECELVRIDCQGLNGSDHRKIGAKLKELVPCVLISFEDENILLWRGHNWKSSLPELTTHGEGAEESKHSSLSSGLTSDGQDGDVNLIASTSSVSDVVAENTHENHSLMISTMVTEEESEESIKHGEEIVGELPSSTLSDSPPSLMDVFDSEEAPPLSDSPPFMDVSDSEEAPPLSESPLPLMDVSDSEEVHPLHVNDNLGSNNLKATTTTIYDLFLSNSDMPNRASEFEPDLESFTSSDYLSEHSSSPPSRLQDTSEDTLPTNNVWSIISPSTEGVLLLRKQAIEIGCAVVLDNENPDADFVYKKAVDLWKSAPPGPVYRHGGPKKLEIQETEKPEDSKALKEAEKPSKQKEISDLRVPKTLVPAMDGAVSKRVVKKSSKNRSMKDIREDYLNIAPRGTLQVDELAKLLS